MMAENSEISWTTHTFNPLWGCTKISPACTNCYAATLAGRFGVGWGPKAERRTFGEAHWNEPRKWDRKAAARGVRERVFCASMADVWEDHPAWETERPKLWALIEATPNLDWLLLTKRPENIRRFAPEAWYFGSGFPSNVWLGATVESQDYVDRIHDLLFARARVHFVSCEPLLGPLRLDDIHVRGGNYSALRVYPKHLDLVIAGGESGHGARPSHPDWFRSLRDQCVRAGVAFHFKQWGAWAPPASFVDGAETITFPTGKTLATRDGPVPILQGMQRVGKKAAGRTLDGRTWDELPEVAA